MPDIDTISWYAFAIPLYAVYVGIEYLLARRRPAYAFTFNETISNLSAGLGTLLIGLFIGPVVIRGWHFVQSQLAPVRWPAHGVWKLPAAMLLSDFCYYVYHRATHRVALFWSVHAIHHQHEHLNSSVGFRLEWLADPVAALFFVLMPLSGVDSTTGFEALALVSVYAATAHSPVLPRPTWGIFVTPAVHGAHHSRDARFAGKNFGAMFSFWDRLFGTWQEPTAGEALRADLPSICRTHNGVTTQWSIARELGRALRAKTRFRDKLAVLLQPPVLVAPPVRLRSDAELSPSTRIYVLAQFCALVALSGWVLWFRARRPLWVQLFCTMTVMAGLYTLGLLLDGHPRARDRERLRLAATGLVGIGFATYAPWAGTLLGIGALGGLAHSLLLTDAQQVMPSAGAAR